MHQEKLKFLHVVHEELQEPVGEDVPGALVGSCGAKNEGTATRDVIFLVKKILETEGGWANHKDLFAVTV